MNNLSTLSTLTKGLLAAGALALGVLVVPSSTFAAGYTVRPGDWLSTIAPRFGLSWQSLCAHNRLANCHSISAGQVLDIPASGPVAAPAAPRVASSVSDRVVPTHLVMGKRYVYGANGPDAFDCSSMTQHLARQMGFSIPRTSQAQWGAGRPITRGELWPGDLILMNGGGHVGMYLGNNQMIQALNPSQGIIISSFEYGTSYNRVVGYRALGH